MVNTGAMRGAVTGQMAPHPGKGTSGKDAPMRVARLTITLAAAGLAAVGAAVPTSAAAPPTGSTRAAAAATAAQPADTHPPAAPTGVALADDGVGRLLGSWQPPSDDGGAAITGYLLQVFGANHAYVGRVVASPAQTSEVFTGLRPGVTYRFYVNAQNSVGYSHASPASNFATTGVAVSPGRPDAPVGPLVTPVTGAGLHVTWRAAPANGAPVQSYRLTVTTPGGAIARQVTLPAYARSTTVRGLVAGITYRVRITAVNRYGAGVSSDPASAEALAVVRGSGVGLYSFGQIETRDDWTKVIQQGWGGLLDTEALGTKTPPYTGLVGGNNPDAGAQAALDAIPSYKGFWVSFWTVDAPDPAINPTLADFYSYGRQAGTYAARHTANLGGTRLPDYLAIDYEGYFSPDNQAQYIAETKGWADGIHRVLSAMGVLYYTAGQNVFLDNDLWVIHSAGYQPAVAPIVGNAPEVPNDGNLVGYQGLFAECTDGSARPSVETVLGWDPDHPISQVEFATAQDECGPGIAAPSVRPANHVAPATPATAPACTSASVGYAGTQAADGMQGIAEFGVRNTSRAACSVTGAPRMALGTSAGATSTATPGPTPVVQKQPSSSLTLQPGAAAYFTVSFTRNPDGVNPVIETAIVTLPGQHHPTVLPIPATGPVTLAPVPRTPMTVSPLGGR